MYYSVCFELLWRRAIQRWGCHFKLPRLNLTESRDLDLHLCLLLAVKLFNLDFCFFFHKWTFKNIRSVITIAPKKKEL